MDKHVSTNHIYHRDVECERIPPSFAVYIQRTNDHSLENPGDRHRTNLLHVPLLEDRLLM